jgi:hypothetical protein
MSLCEHFYMINKNSIQVLLAMCVGLTDPKNGRVLADFDNDRLYKEYLEKAVVPKVPALKTEMKRRALAVGLTKFRKNSVSRPQALEWLKMNPVRGEANIRFLLQAEGKLYATLKGADEEKQAEAQEKLSQAAWTGCKPYLRLYICATEDAALEALRDAALAMEKDELDARNSEERPDSYEQIVADLFNDPDCDCRTDALPSLHAMFALPIDLPFKDMPGGKIDAETVKSRLADARAKLLQVITNWEASGNGAGQRTLEDEGFGHYEASTSVTQAGDNRANFINKSLGHRNHLLYFWYLADKMGVLSHVLNVLSSDMAGDGDQVNRNTQQVQQRRKNAALDAVERKERRDFRLAVGNSLAALAIATKDDLIRKEEDKIERYAIEALEAEERGDHKKRKFYLKLKEDHEGKVAGFYYEIKKMKAHMQLDDADTSDEE